MQHIQVLVFLTLALDQTPGLSTTLQKYTESFYSTKLRSVEASDFLWNTKTSNNLYTYLFKSLSLELHSKLNSLYSQ